MNPSFPLSLTHGLVQARLADLRAAAAHARLARAVRTAHRDPAPRRTMPALARITLTAAAAAVVGRRRQPCPTC